MSKLEIHPGEHLQLELDELDMKAADLAPKLGVELSTLERLLAGKQALSADFALRLGHFFGTSAQFWLNLQALYDLRVAERLHGSSIKGLPTLKQVEAA